MKNIQEVVFSPFTILVWSLILLNNLQYVYSQNEALKFEHYSIAQGISSPVISCILRDHEGYMWFGTFNSIEKYDGYSFTSYKNVPGEINSLNNGYGQTIYEDKIGNIWVGTSQGLDKFNRSNGNFTHYFPNEREINIEGKNHVWAICEDKIGQLWISAGGALHTLDQTTGKFSHYVHNNSDPGSISHTAINSILEDKTGSLWIGTGAGLDKFDRKTKTFIHYWFDNKNKSEWHTNLWVNTLFEDKGGILWLGTRLGLVAFNKKDSTFISYGKELQSISSICEDENGILWIGTWIYGLYSFNKISKTFTHYPSNSKDQESLNHHQISSLYYENSGCLWIGTSGGGLNKLDKTRLLFTRYKHIEGDKKSLYSNDVDCIFQRNEGDIIVVSDGEIQLFNPQSGALTHLFHSEYVMSVVGDKHNNVWFGSRYGMGRNLIKLDSKQRLKKLKYSYSSDGNKFPQDISSMFESKTGSIWIGTSSTELFLLNPVSEIITAIDLDIPSVYGIKKVFEDDSGLVWLGTQGAGLICYNPTKKTSTRYTSDPNNINSISSNTIFSIYQGMKGTLWIGTDTGLNKYESSSKSFIHYTERTGLANNIVLTILGDNHNNLWLSTPNGISKFSLKNLQFKNYFFPYQFSKIWDIQPPGHKTRDGEIYYGGASGLIRFHPDSIKDNPFIPPVVITSFKIFDKPFAFTNEIHLPYSENFLSFEFAALSYVDPERNQYAYKMEGIDKDWVYSGTRRFASYPNLDAGEYIFRVKGSNNDGAWNEVGTSIAIIISPPFWKTWWAYSLYAALFIFTLYVVRRYEMNRISYKNQVKVDKAILNEKEETEKIKSRFFANISHEFRTPLTLILGPAEKIISNTSDDIIKDANIIKRNSRRLLQLINQLLDLSRLEAGKLKLEASKGNIVSFVKGVALSFESLAESKDINLKLLPEKDFIELYFDKEKMMKILTNLLSNAFKFTPEEGKILVSVRECHAEFISASYSKLEIPIPTKSGRDDDTKGFVEIKIRDTGIGIAQEEIPKLFDRFYQVDSSFTKEHEGTGIGLALTKELVELHHGIIKVESNKVNSENGGTGFTEFIVELPLGRDHLKDEDILNSDPKSDISEIHIDDEKYFMPKDIQEELDGVLASSKNIILVVEDNYDMREYIKDSLSGNYLVEEAVNGEQGVRKAEKIIPDLIISDMMMPKMDGNELVRIVKNKEKTSHIPIILLTARSGQESKIEGLETGADDYLTKPFDLKELKARIENLIKIRKKLQEKYQKSEYVFKPDVKKGTSLDEQFIIKVMEVIDKHISDEDFSIEEFGSEVGMSRAQFHRKFKAITGKPASMFLRSIRLARAKKMIEEQRGNISEIAYSVGFASPSYFSKCFRDEFGYSPSDLVS